jgi:hypothetical protein
MKISVDNVVIVLIMAVVGFYTTTYLVKRFGN